MTVMFRRVAILGIGLIGSSIAHAIRAKKLAEHVTGYAKTEATRAKALELGLVDAVFPSAVEAVSGADLIILCSPVGSYADLAREIAPGLMDGAILTDVGSVKGNIARDWRSLGRADVHVIPGHPVAGTEKSGPDAGFASLFQGRWCILTPEQGGSAEYVAATDRLAAFWTKLGSKVERMDAQRHDLVLAVTSHLPHLIAYNMVATAYDMEAVTEGEVVKFSAAGFRDFTRIAASDPTMWRDVFLNNKEAVLEVLGRFDDDLTALRKAIRNGDGQKLFDVFTHARGIRREIIEAGQDTAAANFGRDKGEE